MIDGLQIALKGNVRTGDRQESRENIEIGQVYVKKLMRTPLGNWKPIYCIYNENNNSKKYKYKYK